MKGKKTLMTELPAERCDTKVWSGECGSDTATGSDSHLCSACGIIRNLNHEMHHEGFPHVSGDSESLY